MDSYSSHNSGKRFRKLGAVILFCSLLGVFMISYHAQTTPTTRWHFIIPSEFEGVLAIHYNCPQGDPFISANGKITVSFNTRGVYCTSSDSFAYRGPLPTAETVDGLAVQYVSDSYEYEGYGMCCASIRSFMGGTFRNPGPDLTLGLYWVGMMEPRPRSEPEIPYNHLELFLQREFGLRDIRAYPQE
jgi:hypothetical protein